MIQMTVSNIGFNNTLMEKEIKNIPPLTFQSDLISSKIYSDRAKCVFFLLSSIQFNTVSKVF